MARTIRRSTVARQSSDAARRTARQQRKIRRAARAAKAGVA